MAHRRADPEPPVTPPVRRRLIPRRIWNPPGYWRLLAFCAFVIAVVHFFQGVATHTIGVSAEPHPESGRPRRC